MVSKGVDTMRFVLSGLNGDIQNKRRGRKGVNMSLAFFDSHMPRHLFRDEHEWISEILMAPIHQQAEPQPMARDWDSHLGKEVVLSCTLV